MDRSHLFKYFTFESLSKTKDTSLYKEWIGETDREVVVIIYKGGALDIGIGYSEVKARGNLERVGQSMSQDANMNLEKMNKQLNLEWVLPSGFLDE